MFADLEKGMSELIEDMTAYGGAAYGGVTFSEFRAVQIKARREQALRNRLNKLHKLQRRVEFCSLLRYVLGEQIEKLTVELVALKME